EEDVVGVGGGWTKWNDIVVVEVEPVTIALGQAADRLKGGQLRPGRVAERIAAAVLQAPDAEGEFVLLGRCVKVRWHGMSLEQGSLRIPKRLRRNRPGRLGALQRRLLREAPQDNTSLDGEPDERDQHDPTEIVY